PLLQNRFLWLAIGAAILAFTLLRFRLTHSAPREKRIATKPELPRIVPALATLQAPVAPRASIALLPGLAWLSLKETVKNVYFLVIMLAGVLLMISTSTAIGSMYGTMTYPVTYQVLEIVGGSFSLFMLIIITFSSGELIWRERDSGIDQIH